MRSLFAALLVTGCAHTPVRAPSIEAAAIVSAPAAPMWPHTTFWAKLIAIEPRVDADVSLPSLFGPFTTSSSDSRWLITDEGHLQRTNDLSKEVAVRHRRVRRPPPPTSGRYDDVHIRDSQRPSGPNDGVPVRGDGLLQTYRAQVEIPWTCVLRQR